MTIIFTSYLSTSISMAKQYVSQYGWLNHVGICKKINKSRHVEHFILVVMLMNKSCQEDSQVGTFSTQAVVYTSLHFVLRNSCHNVVFQPRHTTRNNCINALFLELIGKSMSSSKLGLLPRKWKYGKVETNKLIISTFDLTYLFHTNFK